MLISVNFENIMQIAGFANQLADRVRVSVDHVSKIQGHNDWNCIERDHIDEAATKNKYLQTQLQELILEFSSKFREVAASFSEFEANIDSSIRETDKVFASALAIPTALTPSGGNSAYDEKFEALQSLKTDNLLENYAVGSVKEPIKILSFNELEFND